MEKEISYTFKGEGLTNDEKIWGRRRFKEYRTSYPHLNKLGNLHLLEELVWKECLQERFKIHIGQLGKDATKKASDINKTEPIPKWVQDSVNDGLTQIVDLKNKLGMFEDQKVTDEFKKIQELEEKAAEYRRQHPFSYKCTCPFCAKIFYLKRKTEGYEEFKSPFYAEDKVIYNRPLFKLFQDGKLTKEETAEVLGVSTFYVEWIIKKLNNQ